MANDGRNGRKGKTILNNNDEESGLLEAASRFWQKSYAGDYLGLMLLVAAYIVMKLVAEPFHHQFRLDDPRIQHPHAEVERVPPVYLFIYAGVLPALALVAWALAFRPDTRKIHITLLGLAIALATTLFLTDLFKDAIGRPRPDLIARCKPDPSAPRDEMVTIDVCTETNHHKLHDGWRSYPSGHSSFAFAGLGWLALFLASQFHVLRPRASLSVAMLCAAPLVAAAMIAISRLEDYRHDVGDVVTGSALGFAVAYFNWRRYYPSLLSGSCDEPHSPPPTNGRSSPGGTFQRVRDEEEGYLREAERYSVSEDR